MRARHSRKNWPRPETTTGQSRLQTTNRHQQPLSTPKSANKCRPAEAGHSAQIAIWHTMVKQKDNSNRGLRNTKRLSLCLTTTPRLHAMPKKTAITWTSVMSKLLDTRRIFKNDFSWKPGCQLKIWTLGTTTSPFQRSKNLWLALKSRETFETLGATC